MAGTTRTYGQLCGLAASMDLLGERWTLLILRELSRGPKRFGDLLQGLEGIGTNLLSTRLKALEAADVVEAVTLPAPAAVPAYALGPRGETLEPILEDLALWGFELLESDMVGMAGIRIRAVWAAMSMRAHMDRAEADPPEGLFAFRVDGEEFWLATGESGSLLRDGSPSLEPDASLEVELDGFFALATGLATPRKAGARINGDEQRLEELLHTFRLPLANPPDPD